MEKFKNLNPTNQWQVVRDHFYKTQPNYEEFTSNHAEHIRRHFAISTEWAPLRNYFFETLRAAEFHWFFVQGVDALLSGLYVPAVSSMLNGIEASLRVTMDQITNPKGELVEISPYKVLSNTLIKSARDSGMPTDKLAFPNEVNFNSKLESQKPSKVDVELVRQRNNICHGNIFEFINRDLGKENSFFTPVSLKQLSFQLLDISGNWAEHLAEFRKSRI
jgi:hypothetical protein